MKVGFLFLKFSMVGLSGVIVNLIIYSILLRFGVYYLIAAAVAFVIAVTNNFYWNFIWTFKDSGKSRTTLQKYTDFLIISLINFGINLGILKIFHGILGLDKLLSQVLAIGITSVLNFLGNYFITFHKH